VVAVVALPESAPVNVVAATELNPESDVIVLPSATVVLPSVIEEFVSAVFGTPDALIVIEPAALATLIPTPAVNPVTVYPDPFPISKYPLDGVVITPVPPELVASGESSVNVPVVFAVGGRVEAVPAAPISVYDSCPVPVVDSVTRVVPLTRTSVETADDHVVANERYTLYPTAPYTTFHVMRFVALTDNAEFWEATETAEEVPRVSFPCASTAVTL
jgi:hypothetical protein